MSDVDATNVQDIRREAVSIEMASIALGIRPDTLRKRLQRGQEDGFKGNDGRWRVYVSAVQDMSRTQQESPGNSRTDLDGVLDEVRARINDKNEVIVQLREQLSEKDRQINALIEKLPVGGSVAVPAVAAVSEDSARLAAQHEILQHRNNQQRRLLKMAYKQLSEKVEKGG